MSAPPEQITEIENVWIPLAGGAQIAARVWMPKSAEANPVPAISEYLPYRKRDFMRTRDEPIHRYFADHGYACLRVDVRGTGDSDGALHDEYSAQELSDALEVIAWIASQSWCTGSVGMVGISWGGINSLQVAALRPPNLKAIITLCSCDDRYADDAHYMGGCLLNENMQWGSILMNTTALPPDPEIVGDVWREMWLNRLNNLDPFPATWMRHPWRDDYWKHGSVCEDFSRIQCAVYAIGGWADGYSNAVPRLLRGLSCPRKGLIGPWAHAFPHDGVPGPAIGYLQEAIRWWDHWLKGEATGIMDEPMMRAWMQESVLPQPQYEVWPGRWVAEDDWPSDRIKPRTLFLAPNRLMAHGADEAVLSICSPQTTGVRAGEWCAFGAAGEMPRDQRPDDGGSLTFDTGPLTERFEILGSPEVTLELCVDRPVAMIAARLCDIAPDGSSLRVSYTLLNLTHRESHENPTPLEPGTWYTVPLKLNDIAHAFPAGHRIRLALSTCYWPIAWPSPEPVTLMVRTGSSKVVLPERPPRAEDEHLAPFQPPDSAPGTAHKKIRHLPMRRAIVIDLTTNEMVYTLKGDGGEFDGATLARIEEIDLELGYYLMKRYRIIETDPLSAKTELVQRTSMRRGDWSVRVECRTQFAAVAGAFQFTADLEAFEGDEPVIHREWTLTLPRKLV